GATEPTMLQEGAEDDGAATAGALYSVRSGSAAHAPVLSKAKTVRQVPEPRIVSRCLLRTSGIALWVTIVACQCCNYKFTARFRVSVRLAAEETGMEPGDARR